MKKAKWIWRDNNNSPDEYVRFFEMLEYKETNCNTVLHISCDSNYAVHINSKLAAFGQYADYPHYKIFDSVDITPFIQKGKNDIVITVWYYGVDSQTYIKGNAGVIYEIENDNKIAAYSKEGTPCAIAEDYVQNKQKIITSQLGLSYCYDSRGIGKANLSSSVLVKHPPAKLYPRPVKKLEITDTHTGKLIDRKNHIYDVGTETAGFLQVCYKAPIGEKITIFYGEHILDGEVRGQIGDREFSVELIGNGDYVDYTNPFRRLGCRYLQVSAGNEIFINFIGIKETSYPLTVNQFEAGNPLRQKIYNVAVRTLQLCMHEHYEDTPWREQALYTMDSRNQMLCGYYAFEEFEFARANLLLMSKAQKEDKLLPLCFPAGLDFPIPVFSLIYIIQMNEYADNSGDLTLLRDCLSILEDIVEVFLSRRDDNGLIPEFESYWNFYEWSDNLDGIKNGKLIHDVYEKNYALALNCFVLLSLEHLNKVYNKLNIAKDTYLVQEELKNNIRSKFYNSKRGLFKSYLFGDGPYSQLCNSLALLTGCALNSKSLAKRIITSADLTQATLSMRVFLYDALLKADSKYNDYILSDIDKIYGYMLKHNATSFWETIKGANDFDGAGSLCHGWSTIPVLYYHKLLLK